MPKKNNTDERQNEIEDIIDDILNDEEQRAQEENRDNDNDLLIDEVLDEINGEGKKDENEILIDAGPNENQQEADQPDINQADNAEEERKKAEELKAKVLEDSVNLTMFADRINTFNGMFHTDLNYNDFTSSVMNAWLFMKSDNKQVQADGKSILGDLFKKTLSDAFAVERKISYQEHRLPDFPEIIRSANELLRVAMYTQTDLYTMENSKELFDATAFGGLSAKEMAELATGMTELDETDSVWDIDQKSDQAWEIQSAEAKALARQWLEEEKPYEKMINEMNALSKGGKNISDNNAIYNKLAAAEWMLMQDEKMMVENPEDPHNPMPNWGNRYWKAIIQAREALNIPKHTSMRELIQNDYAAMSKSVYSTHYNERQINEQVMDADARGKFDSFEAQESEFTIQREAIKNNHENKEPRPEDIDPNVSRYPYPVKEENEYEKQRNAPKENSFINEKGPQEKMVGIDK